MMNRQLLAVLFGADIGIGGTAIVRHIMEIGILVVHSES